eukprot:jgi/Hompol1/814/HPOL_001784-RA
MQASAGAVEPWDALDDDPSTALARFPVAMRHAPRRDDSEAAEFKAALSMLNETQLPLIPPRMLLLLLSSPHLGMLDEDHLWMAYRAFIASSHNRLQILPEHLDATLQHLLFPFVKKTLPDIASLLAGSLEPAEPLPSSVKEKVEMIIGDYAVLGFDDSPTVWSSKIIVAVCDSDLQQARHLYIQAHKQPEKPFSPNSSISTPPAVDSTVEDLTENKSKGDKVEQQSADPAATESSATGVKSVSKPPGLNQMGYQAFISLQLRQVYLSGLSNVSFSLDTLENRTNSDSIEPSHRQQSTPISKSNVWEVMSDMRRARIEPTRSTLEMWLFLFGRLGDPTAVKKVLYKIYSMQIEMRPETFHVALDALAETLSPEPLVTSLLDKHKKSTQNKSDRAMITALIKYRIALDRPRLAWSLAKRFYNLTLDLDDRIAAMLIFVAAQDHPSTPDQTLQTLGQSIKRGLLNCSSELSPSTWTLLIRSFGAYSDLSASDSAVSAYRTLQNELKPHWIAKQVYGFTSQHHALPLDLKTLNVLAASFGQLKDQSGVIALFKQDVLPLKNVLSDQDIEQVITAFMSAWIDAGGSVDQLRDHVKDLRNVLK